MTRRTTAWEDEVHLYDMTAGAVRPLTWWMSWERPAPDLTDVLAARLPGPGHMLAIWEPLHTKAPSPARCFPFCCLVNTVIFYHRPYVMGWPHPYHRGGRGYGWTGASFLQYDQIETRLRGDDLVEFEGEQFKVGGGHVAWSAARQWAHKRWWMKRWARRQGKVIPMTGKQS